MSIWLLCCLVASDSKPNSLNTPMDKLIKSQVPADYKPMALKDRKQRKYKKLTAPGR